MPTASVRQLGTRAAGNRSTGEAVPEHIAAVAAEVSAAEVVVAAGTCALAAATAPSWRSFLSRIRSQGPHGRPRSRTRRPSSRRRTSAVGVDRTDRDTNPPEVYRDPDQQIG